MKIGFDARFLTHPQNGGFKTYTEGLVRALVETDTANEYVFYLDRQPPSSFLPERTGVSYRVVPGDLPVMGMAWREQVALAGAIAEDHPDVFHAPSLTAPLRCRCPLVVTIHDTIWLSPEKFQSSQWSSHRRLMEQYYRTIGRAAARRAAMVITVSHAAAASIREQLHIDDARLVVTHEAAPRIFKPSEPEQVETTTRRFNLNRRYLLAIGSADPRKNLTTLIKAYALLPEAVRAEYELAIVWTSTYLTTHLSVLIESLGLANRVRHLERVSTIDLVSLYSGATLFIFPSLAEGFGLPLLEAMACGTPVVASNNTSIPEIVGGAALLADGDSAASIAENMRAALSNEALRRDLSELGRRRAAGFSWEKCAEETVAAYRAAIAGVLVKRTGSEPTAAR